VTDDAYFDAASVRALRLFWTVATRRQLDRWEPIVAAAVRDETGPDGVDAWSAQIEHHFALVAARNLLRALDLSPPTSVTIDETLRDELIEGRDLHEHWPENMPVFNLRPRRVEPRFPSGKAFASRNPERGPYWALGWGNKTGARLLPHVSAPQLHQLLDAVEAEVLAKEERLRPFVPPRAPSPWVQEAGEWWPRGGQF
jgi:hypothetical protein